MKSLFNKQHQAKPVLKNLSSSNITINASKEKQGKDLRQSTVGAKLGAYSLALAIVISASIAIFYQDVPLSGQVTNTEYVYTINNEDFNPVNLEVSQGGLLSIFNKSDSKHVLFSDELCAALECFITPDLKPGSNYKMVIPLSVPEGTYEIRSLANKTLRGQITITTGSVLSKLPPGANTEFKNMATPTHRAPQAAKPNYNLEAFNQASTVLAQNPNAGSYSPTPPVDNIVHTSAPGQPTTGGWTIAIAIISAFIVLWLGARKRKEV